MAHGSPGMVEEYYARFPTRSETMWDVVAAAFYCHIAEGPVRPFAWWRESGGQSAGERFFFIIKKLKKHIFWRFGQMDDGAKVPKIISLTIFSNRPKKEPGLVNGGGGVIKNNHG